MTSYKSKRYRSRCNLGLIDNVLAWLIPDYGYFIGGYSYSSLTDLIEFSSGITSASTISNLSVAKFGSAGISDKNLYGYVGGGATYTDIRVALTDRIVFSTKIMASNSVSDLSMARYSLSGVSNGDNYGYFLGGFTGAGVNNADRIVFSSGITSAYTTSNLNLNQYNSAQVSDGVNYGYISGGQPSLSSTDRISFASEICTLNTTSNLSIERNFHASVAYSTFGYFAGGAGSTTTMDRIEFSSGVTSSDTVSNLSQARYGLIGVSDGNTFGYFAGGLTGGLSTVTTSDRIVFSTEITSASTISNLTSARARLAGLSSCAI
jgi:hypothetical protein